MCFLIRTSACDHRVLQPRWPAQLPSPQGWDLCELCYEHSRHYGELKWLQEHMQSETVHQKVLLQNTHVQPDDGWPQSVDITLTCSLHPTVTAASPAHRPAATWRWDPASCRVWNHLKVNLTCFYTNAVIMQELSWGNSLNASSSCPWVLLILFVFDSFSDPVCEETGDWPLDIDDLLRFSFQVAQGLDFLAAKNVSDFSSTEQIWTCKYIQNKINKSLFSWSCRTVPRKRVLPRWQTYMTKYDFV